MISRAVRVIKAEQVVVNGSVRLEIGGGAPVRTEPSAQAGTFADVPQEARIIESNNEYVIIEVTCGCGRKSHVQCNFGDMAQTQE
jgi:hypothetical protein